MSSDTSGNNRPLILGNSPSYSTSSPWGACYGSVSLNPMPAYNGQTYKHLTSNYLNFGNINFGKTPGFSLCFWFYFDSTGQYMEIVFSLGNGGSEALLLQRSATTNTLLWQNYRSNIWKTGISTDVPYNKWQHTCSVVDDTLYLVYLNGKLLGTSIEAPAWPNTTFSNNVIGGFEQRWGWSVFTGKFADVRMYSNALSASEVANLYNWNPCFCCLPGMISVNNSCACPNNTYLLYTSSVSVSTYCQACPSGSTTFNVGATNSTQCKCPGGTFNNGVNGVTCQSGSDCSSGSVEYTFKKGVSDIEPDWQ
jgi:hypothetical protein